jgi:hypothetical protein
MSDAPPNNGRSSGPAAESGVLANLPRTRPQRSSPRRSAARATKAKPAAANTKTPSKAKVVEEAKAEGKKRAGKASAAIAKEKPQTRRRAKSTAKPPAKDTVPRQGFESESDGASGPVHPPGGAELIASAAELAGELAKTGVTTGARLLKDFLSRLPSG